MYQTITVWNKSGIDWSIDHTIGQKHAISDFGCRNLASFWPGYSAQLKGSFIPPPICFPSVSVDPPSVPGSRTRVMMHLWTACWENVHKTSGRASSYILLLSTTYMSCTLCYHCVTIVLPLSASEFVLGTLLRSAVLDTCSLSYLCQAIAVHGCWQCSSRKVWNVASGVRAGS